MFKEIISIVNNIRGTRDNGSVKKCAWCGNEDSGFLIDDDDDIYCQKCFKRTRKDNGNRDSVICPHCRKIKDRKAYQCSECGY